MARRASVESRLGKLSGISTFGREIHASRPLAHVGAEVSGRVTAIEIAHAQLYNVDVERKKRIDDAIDYFGGGTSTSRRVSRVCWILILLCVLSPAHDAWAGSPSDQLRAGIDRVLKILGDPELEGDTKLNQRRTAIVTVASEIFDFGEMAKRSLGPYWAQRTLAERGEFVHLFTAVVEHSYISRVDQRSAGTMTVQGELVDGEYAMVRTRVPLSSGQEMPIDYRMHSIDDRWRVYDLSVDGVSLVANYRAQIEKILRSSSYEALVAKFKSLQGELSAPSIASEASR